MKKRIAIQGFEGSFHQMAARKYWGAEVEVVPCATFRSVIKMTEAGIGVDAGLMAIENSLAGSILPNYNLLQQSGLKINGEVYLEIRQNLLVYPGVSLSEIKEVHSHPMAILQCLDFLDQFTWKLVETEDTALSARYVAESKSRHIAAIASDWAATCFGLTNIQPDIHTLRPNYTRFLVLSREPLSPDIQVPDKASVCFHVDNTKGSLARVLGIIAAGGINLSKLQSSTIAGSNWQYRFHADMEFAHPDHFRDVLKEMDSRVEELKIYGVYKKAIALT